MPGPLHFLDGKPSGEITTWLRSALCEKIHVPLEYPDQPVAGAISAASPALSDQARRDLDGGVIMLLREIHNGKPRHPYVANLLRLATDLDMRTSAVPILRPLAEDLATLADRVGWQTSSEILFALLNLRDLRNPDFWITRWEINPRCLTPVVIAALFDLSLEAALDFLPNVPNSEEFGDLVVLNLDHYVDALPGVVRSEFFSKVVFVATNCQPLIRRAIQTWLEETAPPFTLTAVNLSLLFAALPPQPDSFVSSLAILEV